MGEHVCIVVPVYVRQIGMVEEQVCLGVLLRCPSANCYVYRLATDDEAVKKRVLDFFPKMKRETLERVLDWASHDIEYTFDLEQNKGDKGAFANLIRPRENIVRYGEPQALQTADPASELDRLYHLAVSV